MCIISSSFRVSCFRNQGVAWLLLTIFLLSFAPSISLAQQPTATIKTLSGDVLVSGQAATVGTVLQTGDTIQTQTGASVVLELSDGSELHLGEKTQITVADLAQTSTGARVSRVKLLWGRIRAFLSPQHQIEGSSFDLETPNALVGVKFSEPDIEVSYSLEKAETVGIAHTVELLAKNLMTNEEVLVPVGSTVVIVGTSVKIVAGMLTIASATEAGTTGTGATSAGTSSPGSSGMGTGTKVAIGAGAAAAAGGVAAIAASSGDGGESETAESTGDLSGRWEFTSGSCVAQGCTDDLISPNVPSCIGIRMCDCCDVSGDRFDVSQTDNIISGIWVDNVTTRTLNGVVEGNSVSFTIESSIFIPILPNTITLTGVIDGNTIRGTFSGSADAPTTSGGRVPISLSGTFTVTIQK